MLSQELANPVQYPALKFQWLVGVPVDEPIIQRNFKSDFDLELYNPLAMDIGEIERHVRAFLAEKLIQPRSEHLWIGKDGALDPNYVAMMQKSVNYWRARGDERAATRFEKELEGAQNIVKLVTTSALQGDPLPIVVNASDPGDFYVDEQGRKKSVTFVWMLDSPGIGGWNYKVISLPTQFIGLEKHWELLEEVGSVQKTRDILQESLSSLTAERLIAYPVLLDELIHSVDEVAKKLGFESWDRVEEIAANQLALESDPYAHERRETMVQEFTNRIVIAVQQNISTEKKEALVNAMSDMFALEAGSRDYLGLSSKKIKLEIEKNVRLSLAEKLKVFDKPPASYNSLDFELGDLQDLYAHRAWMIQAFATNPLAQEARATGCGGSGTNYSQSFGVDRFSFGYESPTYAGFNVMQNFGYQSLLTETDTRGSSSSTGKYTEYYDYYPDHCRGPCHSFKPYVAHPKSSEVGCGYFCSDCET